MFLSLYINGVSVRQQSPVHSSVNPNGTIRSEAEKVLWLMRSWIESLMIPTRLISKVSIPARIYPCVKYMD